MSNKKLPILVYVGNGSYSFYPYSFSRRSRIGFISDEDIEKIEKVKNLNPTLFKWIADMTAEEFYSTTRQVKSEQQKLWEDCNKAKTGVEEQEMKTEGKTEEIKEPTQRRTIKNKQTDENIS